MWVGRATLWTLILLLLSWENKVYAIYIEKKVHGLHPKKMFFILGFDGTKTTWVALFSTRGSHQKKNTGLCFVAHICYIFNTLKTTLGLISSTLRLCNERLLSSSLQPDKHLWTTVT